MIRTNVHAVCHDQICMVNNMQHEMTFEELRAVVLAMSQEQLRQVVAVYDPDTGDVFSVRQFDVKGVTDGDNEVYPDDRLNVGEPYLTINM